MSELATSHLVSGSARADGAALGHDDSARRVGRRREDRIVAVSPLTQRAVDRAQLASRSDQPVLVRGPAGSGKSMLARAVHVWSAVASGPLETLLCAAVPEPLQAREFFGCAAGTYPALPEAFDGALARAAAVRCCSKGSRRWRPPCGPCCPRHSRRVAIRPEGGGDERPLRARIVATAIGRRASRRWASRTRTSCSHRSPSAAKTCCRSRPTSWRCSPTRTGIDADRLHDRRAHGARSRSRGPATCASCASACGRPCGSPAAARSRPRR